jgi:hypothetical protein
MAKFMMSISSTNCRSKPKPFTSCAFLITRAKSNFGFQGLYSHLVDKTTGVQARQVITLHGFYAQKDYPEKLRRIRYLDVQNSKRFVFLTNNFTLPTLTIAELDHCRWQIKIFFKWIKQYLHIKGFYGTSENAVNTHLDCHFGLCACSHREETSGN